MAPLTTGISVILLFACSALVSCKNNFGHAREFEEFKATFNKNYNSVEDEQKAYKAFIQHMKYVNEHNALYDQGKVTFKVALNAFSDMTLNEFIKLRTGLKVANSNRNHDHVILPSSSDSIPDKVDWRQKGAVTGVKNQGACGSCWAFSSTGSLEGQTFLKKGKLVSLSEQNLVDCSGKFGNNGCNGGLMENAFQYIKSNKGIDTERSYPYEARDGTCRFNSSTVGATDTGYQFVKKYDEEQLKLHVAKIGPISVAIDANHQSFMNYKSGIFYESQCSQNSLDHGVLVVGYGVENGKDYWLVKNSWGEDWGDHGYVKMSRNRHNNCGIATHAVYPTV